MTGSASTGASGKFKLTAGTYVVAWDADDGTDNSCSFFLFLTTKLDGPTVAQIESSLFPSSKGHAGSATITVKAGTYIVQEDRSGLVSCTRPWSATLTRQ